MDEFVDRGAGRQEEINRDKGRLHMPKPLAKNSQSAGIIWYMKICEIVLQSVNSKIRNLSMIKGKKRTEKYKICKTNMSL